MFCAGIAISCFNHWMHGWDFGQARFFGLRPKKIFRSFLIPRRSIRRSRVQAQLPVQDELVCSLKGCVARWLDFGRDQMKAKTNALMLLSSPTVGPRKSA